MEEKDFDQIFEEMGIKYDPLPHNYNPDTYGKQLMVTHHLNEGVFYSTSTSLFPLAGDKRNDENKDNGKMH